MPAPPIPVGLATKIGVLLTAASTIAALLAAILKGDHRPETIAALITAAIPAYAVITGRMNQAAAHIVAGGQATALTQHLDDPALDDPDYVDDEPVITDTDLMGRTQGSATLEGHTGLKDPS
jgi:hypothetical protein